MVHLASRRPLRLAWNTKHPGDVRGQYGAILDSYQFKTLHSVLDCTIDEIRPVGDRYEEQIAKVSAAIAASFPAPVKISQPRGGFVLWIELPETVDALKLDDLALAQGISVAPGPMFSAKQEFRNCIRISCGHPWSSKVERALGRLGELVERLM